MKLLTILAATAVAAAVAAALSIPAVADRGAGDDATKLADCLRSHGAADAPSGADPFALKKWIATHEAGPAVATCVPEAAPPTELLSCLRAHGLNPPSSLFELKPWMLRQSRTDAGKAAMKPCGVDFDRRPTVQELPKKGDCGGGKVAPAPGGKPKAPPTL